MLVLGDIEILEHWLDVNSLDLHCLSILIENHVEFVNFLVGHTEILLSSESSVIDSYCSNISSWHFLDTISSKGSINISAELNVIEHNFWVVGLVLKRKRFKLLERHVEVQHRKNRLELVLCNFSSSQLVEIVEEFFDSNSLHDDVMLKSLFNIIWVICDLNSLLEISVIDDIKVLGFVFEIGRSCISKLSVINKHFWLWVLWNILWEDVLWLIDICAESKIVDFSNIAFVQILSNQKLEELLRWWDEVELLHHSSELFSGDVAAVSSIVILELRLDEDSLVNDLSANCGQKTNKGILLFICEICSGLGVLNHGDWVDGVMEDNINVGTEIGIVYKTVLLFVFAQYLLNFNLRKLDIECTKACAELIDNINLNSILTGDSPTVPFLSLSKSMKNCLILIPSLATRAWILFSTSSSTFM